MARTRFEDARLRLFVDDEERAVVKVTRFSENSQMVFEEGKYMGDVTPTMDATDGGWRLQIGCEVPRGFGDPNDIFDAYREAVNGRSADGQVRIVFSYKVPGAGTRRAYRYSGCQLNISTSSSDKRPLEFSLDVVAERREKIQ
jgi:hypothetical protein